jgi:hypothetical protein
MRSPTHLLLALAAVLGATAAQQPAFRLIERAPTPPPPEAPPWPTSFADAQAEAKQRHVLMLLFFTAKW